jgi:hypothetical protein
MVALADYIGIRPPGSKVRHSGLNPSPLGTRPRANFANGIFDNVGTSKYLVGTYRVPIGTHS